jgi:hypothetical protein
VISSDSVNPTLEANPVGALGGTRTPNLLIRRRSRDRPIECPQVSPCRKSPALWLRILRQLKRNGTGWTKTVPAGTQTTNARLTTDLVGIERNALKCHTSLEITSPGYRAALARDLLPPRQPSGMILGCSFSTRHGCPVKTALLCGPRMVIDLARPRLDEVDRRGSGAQNPTLSPSTSTASASPPPSSRGPW